MKEFVFELLQAVATAAIPVCAGFLIQFLRRKSAQIGAQTDSLIDKELMTEVTDAVTTAVAYTSQTYVDALKQGGVFDKEAQTEALQKSLDKTTSLLSQSARSVLSEIYGDLNAYLTSRIEAEVRTQKRSEPVLIGEVSEVRESIDTTTLAATTAAASAAAAAAVVQKAMPQTPAVSGPGGPQDGGVAPVV